MYMLTFIVTDYNTVLYIVILVFLNTLYYERRR